MILPGIENELLREMVQAVNYRIWTFLVPLGGAAVGSFLGIVGFYICRVCWDLTHRKRVRLERGLQAAQHMVLEAKADLADQLKLNKEQGRKILKYEKRIKEVRVGDRVILDIARKRKAE